MKLLKIKNINWYKCFRKFVWSKYFNNHTFADKINLIYWENGSWKSSICKILKDISWNEAFWNVKPDSISLEFDDKNRKYKDNKWNHILDKESIIFFDSSFIAKNIHSDKERKTVAEWHEQESWKLIIEFDSIAINLREEKLKKKQSYVEAKDKITLLDTQYMDVKDFELTDKEIKYYNKYKKQKGRYISKEILSLNTSLKELEFLTKKDEDALKDIVKIQAIDVVCIEVPSVKLSSHTEYRKCFEYPIETKSKIIVDKILEGKIKNNEGFYEQWIVLFNKDDSSCPFCESKKQNEYIKKIIEVYNHIYDTTYEQQLKKFSDMKWNLIHELELIESEIEKFDLQEIFLKLKTLQDEFSISFVYAVSEEKWFKKVALPKLVILKDKLTWMNKPSFEDIQSLYFEVKSEIKILKKFYSDISKYVKKKNVTINRYKRNNTSDKLKKKIDKNTTLYNLKEGLRDFLKSDKLLKQNKKRKYMIELKKLSKKMQWAKEKSEESKKQYEDYVSWESFWNVLQKMQKYFASFNFDFTLELDTKKLSRWTKEYPFAFSILDKNWNERTLEEWLSEWEIQILSICFFFAFIDIQSDNDSKILVFDDPISSLDNANLSHLVELISSNSNKFSQIFICTHHRTFYKFLQKIFKKVRDNIAMNLIYWKIKNLYDEALCVLINQKHLYLDSRHLSHVLQKFHRKL